MTNEFHLIYSKTSWTCSCTDNGENMLQSTHVSFHSIFEAVAKQS